MILLAAITGTYIHQLQGRCSPEGMAAGRALDEDPVQTLSIRARLRARLSCIFYRFMLCSRDTRDDRM